MQLGSGVAWLWCKPAAIALIGPLARELPYAKCVALKRQKTKKKLKHLKNSKEEEKMEEKA